MVNKTTSRPVPASYITAPFVVVGGFCLLLLSTAL
jgi:hypothetical protein